MATKLFSGATGAIILPAGVEALIYDWTLLVTTTTPQTWHGSFTVSVETSQALFDADDPVTLELADADGRLWSGPILTRSHPVAGGVILIPFEGAGPLTRHDTPFRPETPA